MRNVAKLTIFSWAGIGLGAEHWMGELRWYDTNGEYRVHKIERTLTQRGAAYENKKLRRSGDGDFKFYRPGDKVKGWLDREQLIQEALTHYRTLTDLHVLLLGEWASASVQECLDAPDPEAKARINELYAEADRLDFYSGRDDNRMAEIDREFDQIIKSLSTKGTINRGDHETLAD